MVSVDVCEIESFLFASFPRIVRVVTPLSPSCVDAALLPGL